MNRLVISLLLLTASGVLAQVTTTNEPPQVSLTAAILSIKADIEQDTLALNQLREEIATQRNPLAERMHALQQSVIKQRAQVERNRALQQQSDMKQARLVSEVATLERDCNILVGLVDEYTRAMVTRQNAAESSRFGEYITATEMTFPSTRNYEGLAGTMDAILSGAVQWNRDRMGGDAFSGVALDAAGIEHQGRFAVFGPLAYFAAANGNPAGLTYTQMGTLQPTIYDKGDKETAAAIGRVLDGGEAILPVDVTMGDAVKIGGARMSFSEQLGKGGLVMIPLLAVALLALALIIWKSIELRGLRIADSTHIHAIIDKVKAGDIEQATSLVQHLKDPLRLLVAEAIAHRDAHREHLEEIVHEHVLRTLPYIERYLGTLAVLGGVAPLLGLLGTVTGMIHTFQLVTIFGSGDAKLLSGGISEALITTEFGLAIAIPVLLAHAFLVRRAHGIVSALEQTAVSLVNELKIRTDDS